MASSNGTPAEVKIETIKSLIDFDDDPEPPAAPAIPQAQQTTVAQLMMPANSSDNNWASFDVAPEVKVSQGPSNVNPLESVLSQLSVPASLPGHTSGVQGGSHHATAIPSSWVTPLIINDSSASLAGPVTGSTLSATAAGAPTVISFSTFPANGVSVTSHASLLNDAGLQASLQYQQPLFTTNASQPIIQQSTLPVGGALNNQVCSFSHVLSIINSDVMFVHPFLEISGSRGIYLLYPQYRGIQVHHCHMHLIISQTQSRSIRIHPVLFHNLLL